MPGKGVPGERQGQGWGVLIFSEKWREHRGAQADWLMKVHADLMSQFPTVLF